MALKLTHKTFRQNGDFGGSRFEEFQADGALAVSLNRMEIIHRGFPGGSGQQAADRVPGGPCLVGRRSQTIACRELIMFPEKYRGSAQGLAIDSVAMSF